MVRDRDSEVEMSSCLEAIDMKMINVQLDSSLAWRPE
jgi:hypothetical protein